MATQEIGWVSEIGQDNYFRDPNLHLTEAVAMVPAEYEMAKDHMQLIEKEAEEAAKMPLGEEDDF